MNRNTNIFNFKKGSLLPIQFQFFGLMLFILGVAFFRNHPIISLIPVAISVLIFTGQMGIKFDRSNNTWKEYNSFFFIKFGKVITYHAVDRIFINSAKQRRRYSTMYTGHSSTVSTQVWLGYLKFDDRTKIHLLTSERKEILLQKLERLSAFLKIEIMDTTR